MQYVFNKNLGFEKEQRVVIERAGSLGAQQYTFIQEIQNIPSVRRATRSNGVPGYNFSGITLVPTDPTRNTVTGHFAIVTLIVHAGDPFGDRVFVPAHRLGDVRG